MNTVRQANDEQATLWNGVAGRAWVGMQALQDQGLKVTQFTVTTNPDERPRQDDAQQQQQQRQAREDQPESGRNRTRRDTSNGRTFEVRV